MLLDVACRRLDHRSLQHTAGAERPAGSAGPAAPTGQGKSPFSGPAQAPQPMLAVVAEGGSGSEASPTRSPSGDDADASLPVASAEQRLVGGSLLRSLEALQRLCHSPEGTRLAHARVGQLGRQQVSLRLAISKGPLLKRK